MRLDLRCGETEFASAILFEEWATKAQSKDRVVYAIGNIVKDGNTGKPSGILLVETKRRAMYWHKRDLINLVQRKITDGCYEYIAEKRRTEDLTDWRPGR
jgi:hypothetical protein